MVTVQEAEAIIKDHWLPAKTESIPIASCVGRVLAEPIYADRDYPPINRVLMDGIAINYAAYAAGQRSFAVAGIAPAGTSPATLPDPQQCLEVMTGCALPLGSDLVIPYEQIRIEEELPPSSRKSNATGVILFIPKVAIVLQERWFSAPALPSRASTSGSWPPLATAASKLRGLLASKLWQLAAN